mgnify:CR=1 FL=1|tara:strand:- start:703 stop:1545 length:843 start_codon:yes stop_codon:yes gene_type:complete
MKFINNTANFWSKKFPFKTKKSHKYSRGQLIVVAGEREMVGATMLSAEAALRVGVGSVKVICSKKTFPILALKFPSVLKKEINNLKDFKKFVNKNKNSAYLIGPGSGITSSTMKKTIYLLKNIKHVILDADALTSFKKNKNTLIKLLDENKIITPHIKEFKSIFTGLEKINNKRKLILSAVKKTKAVIVLKGSRTLIANNNKILFNKKTSNELAVIGTGDVLAGIISSLVGEKKMKPLEAASAGVWIHSKIAINLKKGIIAEDLIKNLKKTINYIYGKYS